MIHPLILDLEIVYYATDKLLIKVCKGTLKDIFSVVLVLWVDKLFFKNIYVSFLLVSTFYIWELTNEEQGN